MKKPLSKRYREHLAANTEARDVKTNDNPRYATFTYPGLPIWCFDLHTNAPALMSLVGICEDCWLFGSNQLIPTPFEHTLVFSRELRNEGLLLFQTDYELKMSPALYNDSVLKWPLRATYAYGYHTGCFVTSSLELRGLGMEDPMIKLTMCCGFVDVRSRKVIDSLPEWVTRTLDGKGNLQKGLRIERLGPRPANTYRKKMMFLISDFDSNKHTNYKAYMRGCYDALKHAITTKENVHLASVKLAMKNPSEGVGDNAPNKGNVSASETGCHQEVLPQWLTSDIMRKGMKTLRAKFIKETRFGEEVNIHMWQEPDKPLWVFFSLEREAPMGNQVLFEMSLEFFGPSPNL